MTDKNNLIKLGKYFIKELKINKLYGVFLKKYSKNGYNFSCFNEMINTTASIANGDCDVGGFYIKEVKNDYDIIINHINTLIHIYVERGLNAPPKIISTFGEHFFNSLCIDIFGKEKFNNDMKILSLKVDDENIDDELKQAYIEFRKYGINVDVETFKLFHNNLKKSLNEMIINGLY